MLLSAEVRWFWQGSRPDLRAWFFEGAVAPGGGATRADTYLLEAGSIELGIKSRGRKPGLEIKALVSERGPLSLGPLTATIQIWTKVSTSALSLASLPSVVTHKTRWLRKYDTGQASIREIALGEDEQAQSGEPLPDEGCNVEFTEVRLDDQARLWITLGFEAFGSYDRVEASLRAAVHQCGSNRVPAVEGAFALSYPQWLATEESVAAP